MNLIQDWLDDLCGARSRIAEEPAGPVKRHSPDLPFSFMCGIRSSREWIRQEHASGETGPWQDGRRVHRLRWADPQSALSATMELTEFADFPAMEWVVRLCCEGAGETRPIRDFKALDMSWICARESEMPELRRAYGSDERYDDFQYVRDELRQSVRNATRTIRMDSATNAAFRRARSGYTDQRPSATWLPFFNLRTGDDGLFIALGWSGRWFAEFSHDGKGVTDIAAGMEHLELRLRSGEEIRSPRITLLYWQKMTDYGHNAWRRFFAGTAQSDRRRPTGGGTDL